MPVIPHSNTPVLLDAACNGDISSVKRGVARGASIHALGLALLNAAFCGRMEVVQYLAEEARADVEAKSLTGWTALQQASANGHTRVVHYLAAHSRADVEARATNGDTALMLAAKGKRLNVVRCLVEHAGASLRVPWRNGNSKVARYLRRAKAEKDFVEKAMRAVLRDLEGLRMLHPTMTLSFTTAPSDGSKWSRHECCCCRYPCWRTVDAATGGTTGGPGASAWPSTVHAVALSGAACLAIIHCFDLSSSGAFSSSGSSPSTDKPSSSSSSSLFCRCGNCGRR